MGCKIVIRVEAQRCRNVAVLFCHHNDESQRADLRKLISTQIGSVITFFLEIPMDPLSIICFFFPTAGRRKVVFALSLFLLRLIKMGRTGLWGFFPQRFRLGAPCLLADPHSVPSRPITQSWCIMTRCRSFFRTRELYGIRQFVPCPIMVQQGRCTCIFQLSGQVSTWFRIRASWNAFLQKS